MSIGLYFVLGSMILLATGSTYLVIGTTRKYERFYRWLDQLQDRWGLRPPGDEKPVFAWLVMHYWVLKRWPWTKRLATTSVTVAGILFGTGSVLLIGLILFGVWFPGLLPLPKL